MAQKVTAMDIRAAAAFAALIANVSQFCRERQISRQTFYKFRRRLAWTAWRGLRNNHAGQIRRPGLTRGRGPGSRAASAQAAPRAGRSIMGRSRSCGRCSARGGCCTIPLDGVADLDSPRADRGPAAEATQIGDQTVLLLPGPTSAGSPTGPSGTWPMAPRGHRRQRSMTTRVICPRCRPRLGHGTA